MKISEIMKKDFVMVKEKESIQIALEKMNRLKINGMPVVDEEGKLKGIVVKADIYRFLIHPGHFNTCPVEWVMSKDVVTATGSEECLEVVNRLRKNKIIEMPVVEEDKIIGMIGIEDFLDYFIEKGI